MTRIKTARGPIYVYMKACGFKGWASFWRTIYVLPGNEHNERLLRHERCHLEQIERDGPVLFSLRYSWWTLRHGYFMNPYEIEARAAESKSP